MKKKSQKNKNRYLGRGQDSCTLSDWSLRGKFTDEILSCYEVHEWKHAAAVLKSDFTEQYDDLVSVLTEFKLQHDAIVVGGGNKSKIASQLSYCQISLMSRIRRRPSRSFLRL